MKVCHIASHKGNVGDLVNHRGFYKNILRTDEKFHIDCIELREFYYSYRDRRSFDEEMARRLNEYDLVLIGGGGYLDAQWPESETGTTLNFGKKFIDSLHTKVLINAIGYHEYPGKTDHHICDRVRSFLENISERRNWRVTVRNDGSYERLMHRYGTSILRNIVKVPDNGFFCDLRQRQEVLKNRTVGLCVTNDLFSDEYNKGVSTDDFNVYMSALIDDLCSLGYRVVLLPHTPADIGTVAKLYAQIAGQNQRSQIVVAPLDPNSDCAIARLNEYYNLCRCVVGMRFHSLITAINLGIPAIALAGHEQIEGLYRELGLSDYCVRVDNLDFKHTLLSKVEKCVDANEDMKARYGSAYSEMCAAEERYKQLVSDFLCV